MPDSVIHRSVAGESEEPTIPAAGLRDRVVRMALSEGLVTMEEIASAWRSFSEPAPPRGARFWRSIAQSHRAAREAMFALAARIYGFEEVGISVSDTIVFVRAVTDRFSPKQWEELSRLRIVPIGYEDSVPAEDNRIVFACSDPTRIEVNNYLSSLSASSFVLKYAPAASVDYLLDRVLPVLFSGKRSSGRIFKPAVRLVPLDPLRDIVEERGGYRRAA